MAGDWIKMRVDLADDPAVIAMACSLGIDEFGVVGRLHKLWAWADKHCSSGHAKSVTFVWIDRYIGHEGFAQSMAEEGWLVRDDAGIEFPNFDRHNGKSAKTRAEATERKRLERLVTQPSQDLSQLSSQESCDESVTREEKRREEIKNNKKTSKKPPAVPTFDPIAALRMLNVADQTVTDWMTLRKAKRAPVTKGVIDTFLRETEKAGMDLDSVLALCCVRGWTGFEAAWVLRSATAAQSPAARFDPTAHVNRNRPRPQ